MAKYLLPLTGAGAAVLLGVITVACGTDAIPGIDPQLDAGNLDAGTDTGPGPGPGIDAGGSPDGGSDPNAAAYVISGKVTGLTGTGLVLQNNGVDDLAITANGSFAFKTKVQVGKPFNVTVKTQPSAPSQICTVSGATGTVVASNVTTVVVNCAANTFTVGGTVSGLTGQGLILENSNGDEAAVNSIGDFAFDTPLDNGKPYKVTVKTQPKDPSQTCTVTNGEGTVSGQNVTSVSVTCVTNQYSVGGDVIGLSGSGLVLVNNDGDELPAGSGPFTFPTKLDDGSNFKVSVKTQPGTPAQNCVVSGGTGTITGANVTGVVVNCATDKFVIGGTVSGLEGSGLVLSNNGTDERTITGDGEFAFLTPLDDLTAYSVKVKTDPTSPWQTCVVTDGDGAVASAAVTSIKVACSTNSYKVKAKVTGLEGSGLALQNNGSETLNISADGTFDFTVPVKSGDDFLVTTSQNPTNKSQTCTVTNGDGKIKGDDVTVDVACVTNQYSVSVTVSGLAAGNEVVLQNNGVDTLTAGADGDYTFDGALESGKGYAVTVLTNPTTPNQSCTVTGDSGTVTAGNIVGIIVNCSTDTFTAGGNVTGLLGSGLVLENNGNDLPVNGSSFVFPPQADGTSFDIKVKNQPTVPSQTCKVTQGGTGNLAGANYKDAVVDCTTDTFSIGGNVTGLVGTVVLTNNGDDKSVSADGAFTFDNQVASGGSYAVSVKTQPAGMSCVVANGSGPITNASVANVAVTCSYFTSCKAIKVANPAATNGTYTIDPDGSGSIAALSVYCDMTTDGGGYTYYKMTGGISTYKRTETNSCQALGLQLAVPRTLAHLQAMFAWTGNDYSFFQTLPGIYGTKSGGHYEYCPMNDNSTCATVKSDWTSIDGGHWFASQHTNISEPNGDYQPDCWLWYNGYAIDADGFSWYNDGNCSYQTGSSYICSDNAKNDVTSCGSATEGNNATVTCPAGTTIKAITYASYGLPNGTCGNYTDGSCDASTSQAVVEAKCLGQNTCTVAATNATFTDPCVGIGKRLYIQASCE